MPQKEFSETEIVDIKVRLPRYKRDKLKLLSVIEKSSMNSVILQAIDTIITENEAIKKLESKKDIDLEGMFTEGDPIPKEAIDEVIKEWEKE